MAVDVDYMAVASMTDGMVGADLANIIEVGAINMMREGRTEVVNCLEMHLCAVMETCELLNIFCTCRRSLPMTCYKLHRLRIEECLTEKTVALRYGSK